MWTEVRYDPTEGLASGQILRIVKPYGIQTSSAISVECKQHVSGGDTICYTSLDYDFRLECPNYCILNEDLFCVQICAVYLQRL